MFVHNLAIKLRKIRKWFAMHHFYCIALGAVRKFLQNANSGSINSYAWPSPFAYLHTLH